MSENPTVVLVHGAFADASGFAGVIRELAGHTVIAAFEDNTQASSCSRASCRLEVPTNTMRLPKTSALLVRSWLRLLPMSSRDKDLEIVALRRSSAGRQAS
jgi:hypothetical protein